MTIVLRHIYPAPPTCSCGNPMAMGGTRRGMEVRTAHCRTCGRSMRIVPLADHLLEDDGRQRVVPRY